MQWKFACHKTGHVPDPNAPAGTYVFGGEDMVKAGTARAMDAFVCLNCGAYYFVESKTRVPSLIINPSDPSR